MKRRKHSVNRCQFTAVCLRGRDDDHVQRGGVYLQDRSVLEAVGPMAWLHLQTRLERARRLHLTLLWSQLNLQNGPHRLWQAFFTLLPTNAVHYQFVFNNYH